MSAAVRVRLVIELPLGTRKIDVDLPEIPAIGEIVELAGGRRCVVESVSNAPDGSTVSHYVYATAEQPV